MLTAIVDFVTLQIMENLHKIDALDVISIFVASLVILVGTVRILIHVDKLVNTILYKFLYSKNALLNPDLTTKNTEYISGQLKLIVGPMFASKTSEGMSLVRSKANMNWRCLVIKSARDNRFTMRKELINHDGVILQEYENSIHIEYMDDKDESILNINVENYDVIFVDEGQFFTFIADACEKWILNKKEIIIAALNGDANQKPFANITRLYALATVIVFKFADCHVCRKSGVASYSKLKAKQNLDEGTFKIGGKDEFMAICNTCLR